MTDDKSRQRLGRGLASLIGAGTPGAPGTPPAFGAARPSRPAEPAPAPDRRVPPDRLHPNPRNPRRRFDEAELAELAVSLKSHGVVQPLLVRPRPDEPGHFEIVAGERRWRAAQIANLPDLPVVLRDIDDRQALEIAIIENVQRADLNAVEEALGFQALLDEHGYTQGDLADILGKSRSHVANTLRLLKLPDAVQALVADGSLSAGHARAAITAADPLAFARHVIDHGLSVRDAEDLARTGGPAAPGADPTTPDAPPADDDGAGAPSPASPRQALRLEESQRLGRRLSEALGGAAVEVRLKANDKGGIRIDFASRAELDAILALLEEAHHRAAAAPDAGEGPRIRSL